MGERLEMISVLVVTYGQEETLGRTLDSVLAQRIDVPFEIVVADDASRDGTADVAREYVRRFPDKVRLIVNESNLGVQRNYFNALRSAKGEFIADCAGDDFWCDPQKLAKEYAILSADPSLSLVHTGFYYCYPDGSRKPFLPKSDIRRPRTPGSEVLRQLVAHPDTPVIHLCSALYRRDCIIEALDRTPDLFLNPLYRCEDLPLMAAAASAGDIAYIPDLTLCYSVGHPSISSSEDFSKTFDFFFGTTSLRLRLIREHGLAGKEIDAGIRRLTDYMAAQAHHAHSRERVGQLRRLAREHGVRLSAKARIHCMLA